MRKIENLILIGSAGRNNGKTTLARQIMKDYQGARPIYALKIISIDCKNEACHRQEEGCGMCSSLQGDFELIEETNRDGKKDTSKLLNAGATRVFLLKTLRSHIEEAFDFFLAKVPKDALIICESNSLRRVVEPSVFLVAQNPDEQEIKPSAKEVILLADQVVNVMDSSTKYKMNFTDEQI